VSSLSIMKATTMPPSPPPVSLQAILYFLQIETISSISGQLSSSSFSFY